MTMKNCILLIVFGIGFFHSLQASPINKISSSLDETTTPVVGTTELSILVKLSNETAIVDTLTTTDVDVGNETHIRQKRSCGCGCCCCKPCCCCCCRPCCCCCCRPCCCCCRCCCCCCKPCCCCCCRPCCCCGGCGCCGCGGGRKRRSIQALSHKLMDKQIALLRESSESDIVSTKITTTTTTSTSTFAPFTNANIDAFGRSYGNLAFADFTNNIRNNVDTVPQQF